ncbi:MAG: dethiobiotin synthase, partial [Bacteroidota bacterium]
MEMLFITGIGTDVGKTIAASIVAEALGADYWKPVQAGFEEGTDAGLAGKLVSDKSIVIHKEVYTLKTPASPHIAARIDDIIIDINKIVVSLPASNKQYLIIEGAGGLMVPLNEQEFVIDLIERLKAKVILVSKNYLGSI